MRWPEWATALLAAAPQPLASAAAAGADDPLTAAALATASGTSEVMVARLRDDGVIAEESAGWFAPSSVGRVRFVLALESSGVPLDAIVAAVRAGALRLDFFDELPDPVRLVPETHGQMVARLDLPGDLVARMRAIFGSAAVGDDGQVRADELAIFEGTPIVRALGARDDQLVRMMRIAAQLVRRLVAAEIDYIDEALIVPAIAAGLGESEVMTRIAPARRVYYEAGMLLMNLLYRRFADDARFQQLAVHGERAIAAAGVTARRADSPEAVAFVDVCGFSALAERHGDRAAAETADVLAELVHEVTTGTGGRLVKTLGDGALLHFPAVADAVRCVLDVVRRAAARGLPPLHAGIAAGPLVHRDGDVFGAVVNLAACALARAGPDEILATDAVRMTWTGDAVAFMSIGPVAQKHGGRPVELFRIVRTGPAAVAPRREARGGAPALP